MSIERRRTLTVAVGDLSIGGDSPIVIQSMTNTDTRDFSATLKQISQLYDCGCPLVRVAVPDMEAVESLTRLVAAVKRPLVADIHFDHRLALASLRAGAAKVRVNPGNIGGKQEMMEVVQLAASLGAAVRLGVNSGSLPKHILRQYGSPQPKALVAAALEYLAPIEDAGLTNVVLSVKSSDVGRTITAYRLLSRATAYPLHVGVTEAGSPGLGAVRSAVGIGTLLAEGIGDTIRVSLTADPVEEIPVAQEIVSCLGLGARRLRIVSCPTCSRTSGDLLAASARVESALMPFMDVPLTVAIMGCPVNGPGEAREADYGIALAGGRALFFSQGEPQGYMNLAEATELLLRAVREYSDRIAGEDEV